MQTTDAAFYLRTDAGKAEIVAHSIKLTRPARNLLMVIDSSCTGAEWIGKVHGSGQADLDLLVAEKLVAPKSGGGAKARRESMPLEAAVRDWTYDTLYTLLTREAKERFGLIRGYLLILKVESCSDLAGLQRLALEFVDHIRQAHGEESAVRFSRQLGATD